MGDLTALTHNSYGSISNVIRSLGGKAKALEVGVCTKVAEKAAEAFRRQGKVAKILNVTSRVFRGPSVAAVSYYMPDGSIIPLDATTT